MPQVLNLLTGVSQPSVLGLDISNMTGTAAVPIFHMARLYYSPLECKVFFSSEQYIKLRNLSQVSMISNTGSPPPSFLFSSKIQKCTCINIIK